MSEKQGNKIIITAAITGSIHTPTMSPYLPIKPTEIADEAVRAWEAGASVAHIHVRDPDTGKPTSSLDLFREVLSEIKARCDIVICVTTGSMNFALHPMASKFKGFKYEWEEPFLSMTENNIFPNTFKTLREFCEIYRANGTKPELEIYDVGMINNAAHMLMQGHLAPPVYIQFVLGILGGIPATLENLMFMYKTARQALGEFTWSVCAAGRHQMRMCTASILMGGNVRVGLEDSLYLEKGKIAKSNAEQVEKILRIAKEFGFSPASPDETREILGLKGLDKVNF
ncbi:MAG: 3-keto-5-aminohexanoate cleavage protein [Deltaproteobacteria bacterium]|nr:3-keto-5-aminohexanoate cleavage protein [Deltaproteobacteria bacterium]